MLTPRNKLVGHVLLLLVGLSYILVACAANNAAAGGINLDEDLHNRALAHAATVEHTHHLLSQRLRQGDVEALYEVAKSMNDSGDKISSVLIWHALADDGSQGDDYELYDSEEGYDYEGHINSAIALGFSYQDVDKPRSLHYFLMATSKKGAPHQAAMYNAGRLYLELDDPSAALAYIRSCAALDATHPKYARPQLAMTCRKAYNALSNQIIEGEGGDLGLEEAIECFPYASMDDFPLYDSKEFRIFDGAMKSLQKFVEVASANRGSMSNSARGKAVAHLTSATQSLMKFKSSSRDDMSKLQLYLIGYIMERITNLTATLEGGSDEL